MPAPQPQPPEDNRPDSAGKISTLEIGAPSFPLQVEIAKHYLSKFRSCVGLFMHELAYSAIGIGQECDTRVAQLLDDNTKIEFEACAAAFEQHIADAEVMFDTIPRICSDAEQVEYFAYHVQPFLARVQETVFCANELKMRLINLYEVERSSISTLDRKNTNAVCLYAQQVIDTLVYVNERFKEKVNLTAIAEEFKLYVNEFTCPNHPVIAFAVEADVKYALDRFFSALQIYRERAVKAALADYAIDNRIVSELKNDRENSPARLLLDWEFLDRERGLLEVTSQGSLRYSLKVPSALIMTFNLEAVLSIDSISELLAPSNGIAKLFFDRRNACLNFEIDFLGFEQPNAPNQMPQRHLNQERREFAPAARPFYLLRECKLSDGKSVYYEVEVNGAALYSEKAWENICRTLQNTDPFIEGCPELRVVRMSAYWFEDMIIANYERGDYQVAIRDTNPGAYFSQAVDRFIAKYWKPSFPWENLELPSPNLTRNLPEEEYFPRANILTGGIEIDLPWLRKNAVAICAVATPKQLAFRHEQEGGQSSLQQYHPLMGVMLHDLLQVLKNLKLKHPAGIAFSLSPVISIRNSDYAAVDRIFGINVSDSKGKVIATGEFSKKARKFIMA